VSPSISAILLVKFQDETLILDVRNSIIAKHRHLMTIRLRLPGGTLKIKRRDELRRREKSRDVPVWQIGSYFLVWWPRGVSDRPSKAPNKDQQDLN
jgi:hypothetical protein